MPKVVSFPKSKQERAKEKEAAKVMICQGETSADVARALKINHGTLRAWISTGGWRAEISQAKQLVSRGQQNATIPQRVAYDQALTSKKTKKLLSKSSKNVAKWIYQQSKDPQGVEVLFEHASSFKAHVESGDKLFKWNEEAQGNRFAIDLHINNLVSSGQIREIGEDVTVIEE